MLDGSNESRRLKRPVVHGGRSLVNAVTGGRHMQGYGRYSGAASALARLLQYSRAFALAVTLNSRGSRRGAGKRRLTGRALGQQLNSSGDTGISQLTGNTERLKNRGRLQHWATSRASEMSSIQCRLLCAERAVLAGHLSLAFQSRLFSHE